MVRIGLSCLAGAYALIAVSTLPPMWVFPSIGVLALAVFRRAQALAAFLAGIVILGATSSAIIGDRLQPSLQRQPVIFTAVIDDFVTQRGETATATVMPLGAAELPSRIRLSWFDTARLPQLGDTWRIEARLRRPRGLANEGTSDFEGWLFRSRIGATGYVLPGPATYRIVGAPVDRLDRWRRAIAARLASELPDDAATAVLKAVVVGARQDISPDSWEAFAATGTSHLMAISGLHIGLAAACAFAFFWLLAVPFARHVDCQRLALAGAVAAALAYALISGFAIPARRASIMIGVGTTCLLAGIRPGPVPLVAVPAIAILLLDPVAILQPGYLLSFAAVICLFHVGSQLLCSSRGRWGSRMACCRHCASRAGAARAAVRHVPVNGQPVLARRTHRAARQPADPAGLQRDHRTARLAWCAVRWAAGAARQHAVADCTRQHHIRVADHRRAATGRPCRSSTRFSTHPGCCWPRRCTRFCRRVGHCARQVFSR